MRRFISPEELARDRRFKRVHPRNQLLQSPPDDVDTVVRVFEKVAPVAGSPSVIDITSIPGR